MFTDKHMKTSENPVENADSSTVFTSEQVAEFTDTHYRTIVQWASRRLIEVEGGGYGNSWKWSEKNLVEAEVLASLRREGFSLQELGSTMTRLHNELGNDPFGSGEFVVLKRPDRQGQKRNDPQLVKVCSSGEALNISKQGFARLLLPFFFNHSRGVLAN